MAPSGGKSGMNSFFGLHGGQIRTVVFTIVSLAAVVAIWWIAAILYHQPYLPTPPAVLDAFVRSIEVGDPTTGIPLLQQVVASLDRFVSGFVLGILVAIPLGLLMGYFRLANDIGKPVVEVFRPIPPIAWVPLFFLIFGSGLMATITIFLGAFFPLLSNIIFGVRSVEPSLLDAAKTLGAGKLSIFRRVIIPYMVPYMMTGVTIALGISWMCIVAAEFYAAFGGGVGAVIIGNSNTANWEYVYAGMAMLAILGLATTGTSRMIEKRVSTWMGLKSFR